MEDKRVKKIYSYCHIGSQNEISGTVEGIVLPMKTETYIRKDKTPGERMTFALSCRNVSDKIKAGLGVTPAVSKKNPETCFINCTVFGKNIDMIKQFVHEQDVVIASGVFSVYPTGNGDEHRINLRIDKANDIKVLKYHNRVENSKIEEELNTYNQVNVDTQTDEYPEF